MMLGPANRGIRTKRIAQQLRRNATDAERRLWQALRNAQFNGFKFRRQHAFEDYVLDFVCLKAKLVIEVDGGQHAQAVDADASRTRNLERAGFRVLRFWNNEVLSETEAVLGRIWQELNNQTPSPP